MTLEIAQLRDVFVQGCKSKDDRGIGIEREHFLYSRESLKRLTYPQISKVFEEFIKLGWEGKYEGDHVIGAKKDGTSLSIEPGGQFEISAKVHKNLHDAFHEIEAFEQALEGILKKHNFFKLDLGFEPLWRQDDLTWMPKGRYDIMRNYMPTRGHHGHDMMRRTATLQVNLDYTSEENMTRMMRVSQAIHPIISGLFANSPFYEGKLSEYKSFRNRVWLDTDPDRCGLLPFVHKKGMGFEAYLQYLLDIPMYFIYRDGKYINAAGKSFRDFIKGDLDVYKGAATMDDFYDQMTIAFPEARLKTFIEIRGIDASPHAFASGALYTGLFYDDEAFEKVYNLIQDWSFDEIEKLYHDVPKDGLFRHAIHEKSLWDWAKEIYELAEEGLLNRGLGEEIYLAPLRKMIHSQETQSDRLIQSFIKNDHSVGFLFPR